MVEVIKRLGWAKTVLTFIGLMVGIATGVWGLTASVSSSVSDKVEDTARQVIQQELSTYSEDLKGVRSKEIDDKIHVHKLESEIELNEKLLDIQKQNLAIQGQLQELIRRQP